MIRFILVQVDILPTPLFSSDSSLQNRQGKTRLSKWYVPYDDDEKVNRSFQTGYRLSEFLTLYHRLGYVEKCIG